MKNKSVKVVPDLLSIFIYIAGQEIANIYAHVMYNVESIVLEICI
jgi:hypothetical protein